METAEIRELISAFVPEEILRDFELKEVKKECGVYRLYMDEKDDESHYPSELAEAKEVVRCRYMNPCEIQTIPIASQYDRLARTTFPNAYQVTNKFHVLREVLEQLQRVRIRHRQAILALERKKNKTVQEKLPLQEKFSNEKTLKQLLHRSRGLLFKRKKRSGPRTKKSGRRYSLSNSPRSKKPTNTA